MAFSSNDHFIATVGADSVVVRSVVTGATEAVFRHSEPLTHFAVGFSSRAESLFLVADRVIKLWNMKAPRREPVVRACDSQIFGIAFPYGHTDSGAIVDLLSTCTKSGRVTTWDIELNCREVHTYQIADLAGEHIIALSRDGNLACLGFDDCVVVWDLKSRKRLHEIQGRYYTVAFSPDGKLLAIARDKTISVYDSLSRSEAFTLKGHDRSIKSLAFLSDDRTIVSYGDEPSIRFWDLKAHNDEAAFTVPEYCNRKRVILTPDGKSIVLHVSQGAERGLVFRNLSNGQQERRLDWSSLHMPDVQFGSNGKRLAAACEGELKVWDLSANKELFHQLDHGRTAGASADGKLHVWYCISAALSPDGKLLAAVKRHQTVQIKSMETINSGDGNSTTVWDVDTGKELFRLSDVGDSVTFSPDNKFILTGGGTPLVIREATTGHEIRSISSCQQSPVGFCQNEWTLVVRSENGAQLWDTIAGKLLFNLPDFSSATFHRCGHRLAMVDKRRNVVVIDVATGKEVLVFRSHSNAVSFSSDGWKLVAIGGKEEFGYNATTVTVWDATPIGESNSSPREVD